MVWMVLRCSMSSTSFLAEERGMCSRTSLKRANSAAVCAVAKGSKQFCVVGALLTTLNFLPGGHLTAFRCFLAFCTVYTEIPWMVCFLLGPIVPRYCWGQRICSKTVVTPPAPAGNEAYSCHNFSPHFRWWCAANFHNAFSTKFHTPWWWLVCWKKLIFVNTVVLHFPSCLRSMLPSLICWYLRWCARAKHYKYVFLKGSKKLSGFTFLVVWSGKYGYPQITVFCWSRYLKLLEICSLGILFTGLLEGPTRNANTKLL